MHCAGAVAIGSDERWVAEAMARGPRQREGESNRAETGDRTSEIGPREEPDVGLSHGFTPVDTSVRRGAQPVPLA
jgi:hypothetical protein